jgi:hypothetical protein
VPDERLSILTKTNLNHQERNLRIETIEESDHGLYRCIQGDITLNEILLDVLSKYKDHNRCFDPFENKHICLRWLVYIYIY